MPVLHAPHAVATQIGYDQQMQSQALDDAPPQISAAAPSRLASLDVFRGLVILAMLIVNNLGDFATTGYFWKHADWIAPVEGYRSVQFGAFHQWWELVKSSEAPITTAFTQLPLWKHCTLADFVMPCFMLIIGLAMPFSVASQKARGVNPAIVWLRVIKRAAMLVVLGWILCYFRDQFAGWWRGEKPFRVNLGMDVLQLLGVGYLVARILYELPKYPRVASIAVLFLWHWAVLRFWPQGEIPRGTFTAKNEAIGYIYNQSGWWIWRSWEPFSWLGMNWKGLLSVPPAAGMMLIGTLMSDWIRRDDVSPHKRVERLALAGIAMAFIAVLWAFDLPFNKARWTPCYLLWCAGVGAILISMIYVIVDIHRVSGWTYAFIVFGSNALAAYFVTILAKVLLLNTPRIDESKDFSLLLVRYGAGVFITLTAAWGTWLMVRSLRRHCGLAGFFPVAAIALPITLLWIRLARMAYAPSETSNLINLTEAVGRTLKFCLGNWEGGWAFTVTFVLFWWLVLDLAYRRKLFWRL